MTPNTKLTRHVCAINDPLGQTHSPTNSDHYFYLKFVLICEVLISGDGQTYGVQTVITTGLVDQNFFEFLSFWHLTEDKTAEISNIVCVCVNELKPFISRVSFSEKTKCHFSVEVHSLRKFFRHLTFKIEWVKSQQKDLLKK